jgi:hypothetical protein
MERERDPETQRYLVMHGLRDTREYHAWAHMMQRCYNPNDRRFKIYGARGIIVCERWHEASNFLADMGTKPSARHTLGRVDNNGNYEPANCRWELPAQQARNRKTSKLTWASVHEIRMLSRRGYSQNELAQEFNVSQAMIWAVIHHKTWREDCAPLNRKKKERK